MRNHNFGTPLRNRRRTRLSFQRAHHCAGERVVESTTGYEGLAENRSVYIPGVGLGLWVLFDTGALELVPANELTVVQ